MSQDTCIRKREYLRRKIMHRCFRQGSAASHFSREEMSAILKRRDPLFATFRKDFSKALRNSKYCGSSSTFSMPWSVSHRMAVLFDLNTCKMSLNRTSGSGNLLRMYMSLWEFV